MYTKQEIFNKTLSSYYNKLHKDELTKVKTVTQAFIDFIDEAIVQASDEGHFTAYSSIAESDFTRHHHVKICIQEIYAYYIKLGFDIKVKIEADDEGYHKIWVIISWDYK